MSSFAVALLSSFAVALLSSFAVALNFETIYLYHIKTHIRMSRRWTLLSVAERRIYTRNYCEPSPRFEHKIEKTALAAVRAKWCEGLISFLDGIDDRFSNVVLATEMWYPALEATKNGYNRILGILLDRNLIHGTRNIAETACAHGHIHTLALLRRTGKDMFLEDHAHYCLSYPKLFKLYQRWGFTVEDLVTDSEIQTRTGGAIVDFIVKWKYPFSMELFLKARKRPRAILQRRAHEQLPRTRKAQ